MVNGSLCSRRDYRSDCCPAMSIFSCLSPAQDLALGRERLARRYESGHVLIHSDTPALGILCVHSGLVKLTRATSKGGDVVVGLRCPGELLGVREVLSSLPYEISAQTLEPSVLCTVPREAFLATVRDCPELAMRLLTQLAKDYLSAEEQLVTRTHVSVDARTARLLVSLTNGDRPDTRLSSRHHITMRREELALLVGAARETLSRSLSRFAERGAVRLDNGTIEVLDRPVLERLSEQ